MMEPWEEYARKVVSGEIVACLYVKQACERFLSDLQRQGTEGFPYVFNAEAVRRVLKFCTLLRHVKGPHKHKPFRPMDFQIFILANIYGWLDGEGNWRFKNIHLEIPRKNAKTFLAAAIALFDLAFVESTGAQVYVAANSKEQALLCYNDIRAFVEFGKLKPHFEVKNGSNVTFRKKTGRTSFVRPLASDAHTLDGLNPLTVIFDEFHEWADRELSDVLRGSFGGRTNYHQIAITTAGTNRFGPCYEQREQIINILSGRFINEETFGIIYTLDEEDLANWDKPEVWFKANPGLGQIKQLAAMQKAATDAAQVSARLSEFLTKQLNIWLDAKSAWLDSSDWAKCEKELSLANFRGQKCILSLDLAEVDDLTALVYYFPESKTVFARCYMPEAGLKEKEHKTGFNYSDSVKTGHLILTKGKTTDFDRIEADIIQASKAFKISVCYDRFAAWQMIQHFKNHSIKCEPHHQNFLGMNAPTLELERLIKKEEIIFEKNPLLSWQASNAVLDHDSSGNVKVVKDHRQKKVDAIICLIMAIGTASKGKTIDGEVRIRV